MMPYAMNYVDDWYLGYSMHTKDTVYGAIQRIVPMECLTEEGPQP